MEAGGRLLERPMGERVVAVDRIEERLHQLADDVRRADCLVELLGAHDGFENLDVVVGEILDGGRPIDPDGELRPDIKEGQRRQGLRTVEVVDVLEAPVLGVVGAEIRLGGGVTFRRDEDIGAVRPDWRVSP